MPLPASAGVLNAIAIGCPPGAVTVTVEPPHWRHPASSASSCACAPGASRNAATPWMTWIDFSMLRVSVNSPA